MRHAFRQNSSAALVSLPNFIQGAYVRLERQKQIKARTIANQSVIKERFDTIAEPLVARTRHSHRLFPPCITLLVARQPRVRRPSRLCVTFGCDLLRAKGGWFNFHGHFLSE